MADELTSRHDRMADLELRCAELQADLDANEILRHNLKRQGRDARARCAELERELALTAARADAAEAKLAEIIEAAESNGCNSACCVAFKVLKIDRGQR